MKFAGTLDYETQLIRSNVFLYNFITTNIHKFRYIPVVIFFLYCFFLNSVSRERRVLTKNVLWVENFVGRKFCGQKVLLVENFVGKKFCWQADKIKCSTFQQLKYQKVSIKITPPPLKITSPYFSESKHQNFFYLGNIS